MIPSRRHRTISMSPPTRVGRTIELYLKRKAMIEKLKSRKLWAAIVGSIVIALGDQLGLDADTVQWVATILTGYVIGQGIADAGAQGVQ